MDGGTIKRIFTKASYSIQTNSGGTSMDNNDRLFFSTCGLDCGSSCLLKVKVKEGIVQRITTDDQPGPGLKACPRGLTQRNVLYAHDRLQTPLKRVGERGSGRFESISWEEALDHIARELQSVKDRYGPQSIFWLGHSGSSGLLHQYRTNRAGGAFFFTFWWMHHPVGATLPRKRLFFPP